jgi:PhoPQ-activated pathogenicity-related protein
LKLWQATSADRDFRDETWQILEERDASGGEFTLPVPAAGYIAAFVEADFGRGRRAFPLSTNLAVLGAASEPPYGPLPSGEPGVCERGP